MPKVRVVNYDAKFILAWTLTIPKDIGKKWIQETIELSAMLSGLIKTKRGSLKNAVTSIIALII
jgi:hypothetical protein